MSNALLSFVSRGVRAIVTLLLVPFLMGGLGEEAYGVIGIVSSILGFVVLIELGLRPAATREFARFLYAGETRRANELASTAAAAYLLLGVTIVAGASLGSSELLAAVRVPAAVRPDGVTAMIVASVSLALILIATPYSAALASQLRHDIQHLSEMVDSLFRAGFIVAVFTLWEPRLVVWALAAAGGSSLIWLILRWQAHLKCPSLELRRGLVTRRGIRDLAGTGIQTSIAQIADWLSLQSGPLVIGYFLGTAMVAHYVPAMVFATMLQLVSGSFLSQLQPFVTKASVQADIELIRRVLVRSTRYSLLMSGAAAAWVGSLSGPIISIWLGEGFADTARTLAIWCGAILAQAACGGAFSVFLGMGRFGFVAKLNALLASLSIAAALLLIGWAGLGVAAIAVVILCVQVVRSGFWIVASARIVKLEGLAYIRESFLGPLLSIAGLLCSSLALQTINLASPLSVLLVAGLPSLVIFAALAWLVGLSREDRDKASSYARGGWYLLRGIL